MPSERLLRHNALQAHDPVLVGSVPELRADGGEGDVGVGLVACLDGTAHGENEAVDLRRQLAVAQRLQEFGNAETAVLGGARLHALALRLRRSRGRDDAAVGVLGAPRVGGLLLSRSGKRPRHGHAGVHGVGDGAGGRAELGRGGARHLLHHGLHYGVAVGHHRLRSRAGAVDALDAAQKYGSLGGPDHLGEGEALHRLGGLAAVDKGLGQHRRAAAQIVSGHLVLQRNGQRGDPDDALGEHVVVGLARLQQLPGVEHARHVAAAHEQHGGGEQMFLVALLE
ncbi:aminodeoxychorismate synthase component I [Babesia caballi]|uniref:Aminodeoxychorismate synthase component I n=1 Tax=Babesia caballi TaxID=5871 RepID=A0AAV4LSV2_BABCB|nr:aminodeoxychorismate synthase component I [Babesia caballi]